MAAKINNSSELSNILSDKMRIASTISALHNIFRIPQIVHGLRMEKEKGVPCSVLILFLCLFRLCGETVFRGCYSGLMGLLGGEACCKNCFYRMLNDSTMNWRGFLYAVCKSFLRIADEHGSQAVGKPRCLIVDDTLLEKTGGHNRMENVSRVFDHTTRTHVLGFKLQLVVYFDGVTPIPVDFSIHCEWGRRKDFGLRKKDREARFTKQRAEPSCGRERSEEAVQEKPQVLVKMLTKLWKRGLRAQYVLYDSWYHSLALVKTVRMLGSGGMHVLGMDKNGVRVYLVKGRKYTTKTMIDSHVADIRKCDKYRLMYMMVDAMMGDVPVRLFLIKYGKSTDWKVLVTTDMKMRFTQAFETYQIRWTIEVVFRETKQYLGLGGCQSLDFDAQIADATLVFATYTMMANRKRFGEYETMGEVFRELRGELYALTLWQRLIPLMADVICRVAQSVEIDVEKLMRAIESDDKIMDDIVCMAEALKAKEASNQ